MSLLTIEHRGQSLIAGLAKAVSRGLADYRLKAKIRRERLLLAGLDDRALKDIGITRADAFLEANRPFDDIPTGRR